MAWIRAPVSRLCEVKVYFASFLIIAEKSYVAVAQSTKRNYDRKDIASNKFHQNVLQKYSPDSRRLVTAAVDGDPCTIGTDGW